MYLDVKGTDASESQDKKREDVSDSPALRKDGKFGAIVYAGDALNALPSCQNGVEYTDLTASEWPSMASFPTGGALMSLEDIREPYDRALNSSAHYGTTQALPPVPWNNSIAFNQNHGATNSSEAAGVLGGGGGNHDFGGGGTMGSFTGINNYGDFTNIYGTVPTRLDRNITVADLVKLTEAINELTKRMPLPPTPELLKAIEPNLAMTLQLTYLHAYIQNQQLLIDIKNRILGGVLNSCDFMNGFKPSLPSLAPPPPMDGNNYVMSSYDGSNMGPMPLDGGGSDITCSHPPGMVGVGVPQVWCQNQPFAIESSVSDGALPNMSFDGGLERREGGGGLEDGTLVPYYSFVDAVDALHPPQIKGAPGKPTITPALGCTSDMVIDSFPANPIADGQMALADKLPSPKEIIHAIPPEIRNMVKYDGQKHSFVSVYLGPLGARRRRLFSIRKFGIEKALKLATDFAVGSTSAAVASKERKLLEEVCEVAHKCNPRSGEKLDNIEAACAMPETRGLVFSCGAQLWMIIVYDSVTGYRNIETFSVEELGFDGAYKAAVSALERKLQDSDVITSKLSGPLYFWLEGQKGSEVLCLMVTPRDLMRHGSSEQELYIGRFNVAESGGFNAARKRAQKWRSDLRSQLIH